MLDSLLSLIHLISSFDLFSCIFYDNDDRRYVCNDVQFIILKV